VASFSRRLIRLDFSLVSVKARSVALPAATLASVAPVTILTGDWIGNSIDAHLLKIVLEEARRMASQA
jgi:hypothetical protein